MNTGELTGKTGTDKLAIMEEVLKQNPTGIFQKLFVLALGLFSVVYLINPTGGTLEFIPDNLPILGNLDEASATMLLLYSINFFKTVNRVPKENK
ncbi:MAG: hypothetical protein ACLFQV_06320 [Vulcanimicrobiota bacterium]